MPKAPRDPRVPGRAARTAQTRSGSSTCPGGTHSKLTPSRARRRVKRRSWRTNVLESAPARSGQRQRTPWTARALHDPRAPRQDARGRVRGRRSARGAQTPASPLEARQPTASPRSRGTSQPQWSAAPRAAASVDIHRNRDRQPPVQALAIAAQRHQRLQPARARAPRRHPGGAVGRRSSPTTPGPSRASGSTSCPRNARPARASLDGAPPRLGGILEVHDLDGPLMPSTRGSRPAACAARRAACPTARSSSP